MDVRERLAQRVLQVSELCGTLRIHPECPLRTGLGGVPAWSVMAICGHDGAPAVAFGTSMLKWHSRIASVLAIWLEMAPGVERPDILPTIKATSLIVFLSHFGSSALYNKTLRASIGILHITSITLHSKPQTVIASP